MSAGPPSAPEPSPLAPPPGNPRFPLLDGLRAIAALAVLFGHVAGATHITTLTWWSPLAANGDQGVTVFFILSGFLLYRPMVSAQLGDAPATRWRDYARRRVLRIVPAYWLALTALAIYPGLPGVFTRHWWVYYFFGQVYDHNLSIGGIVVAWSLCVEVSFYLLLPVYAGLAARLGRDRHRRVRRELVVLGLLGVGSLVLRFADAGFPITLPLYMQWFSLGMGLAVISAARPEAGTAGSRGLAERIGRYPGRCWAIALLLYVALSFLLGQPPAAGYSDLKEVLVNRLLGGVMALFLVLPAVFGGTRGGWPRRVLSGRTLSWLGLISYGIYLWHLNLLEVIVAHVSIHGNSGTVAFVALVLATAALSVAIAAVSYYLLERPLLRFKPGARRPAGGTGAPRRSPVA